jgi:hypothetical protein
LIPKILTWLLDSKQICHALFSTKVKKVFSLHNSEPFSLLISTEISGAAVAQLGEALRYKPAGHWFDSRWCQWIFSLA